MKLTLGRGKKSGNHAGWEGLVVELKDNGRRRVSWDRVRGGIHSFKWVTHGIKIPSSEMWVWA